MGSSASAGSNDAGVGAGARAGTLLLGVCEAEALFVIVKGDLHGPAARIAGQDERRVHGPIGAEARVVLALAGRVADHDQARVEHL